MEAERNHDNNIHIFINFSNHMSANWDRKQVEQAKLLTCGEIVDIPFPSVDSSEDEIYIKELALDCVRKICEYHPDVVMCQGEFGLTFCVVTLLKERNIKVVYSCSERISVENQTEKGVIKTSKFQFVRFREY